MAVDEYMYLDLRDTSREEFVKCLNRLALRGYRPIWKTLKEIPGEHPLVDVSCYLFRVRNVTRENKAEQEIILAEEGVNQYPVLGVIAQTIYEVNLQAKAKEGVLVDEN